MGESSPDVENAILSENKYSETYNFLEHESEIQRAVSDANENYGQNYKWNAKISKNSIKLYWEYFEYLNVNPPYITITYANPEDKYSPWFNVVDPEGNDLTFEIEFNDNDIADMIASVTDYISNRW